MDPQAHWETVYQTKAHDSVSWYRPHLERSLELIERAAPDRKAAIIDVGGGASTLVDDLLAFGYLDLSVLDVSAAAIDVAKQRLGEAAQRVTWWAADVTQAALPECRYDVWHDRAVFHFLTDPQQQAAYVAQVRRALKPGGHIIVATFALDGPLKCSGLEVARYDALGLHGAFGEGFELIDSGAETHYTPSGAEQSFVYCYCRKA
ncbi:MAG: methyltransferase [Alphaproteobacteria bacterium RIFOXYD12_FULL_60_8]|nr:MAG: methyltransferase [Alphaproteobacteria bacterium RIFOXYD12_FULL_60_8]